MASDLLGKLGEAFILLRADGSQLPADLAKQKVAIEKQVDEVGKKLKGTGTLLTGAVTAPILAIGAAAITSWQKVDEGLDLIRTKTGLTGQALKGLEADFAQVFSTVPDDAATVGAALGDIYARTGLTGQGLQGLTKQLLDLSRVTQTDVSANVAGATRLFGDWSIATEKQADALDFVFKTSQATGSSVSSLMDKVVQFGAPLRQFNFSFEESVALLGKWEKEGVNSELVLGSLRVAMGKFAADNIPLRAGLEATQKAILDLGPGSAATAKAMEVFGARAGPDMAAAILEGRFAVDDLVKTIKGSKDTITTAANDTKDFGDRWAEFQNQLTLALEPLGGELMSVAERAIPLLQSLASGVSDVAKWFTGLPGPVQDTALVIGGLAAAAGPVIWVLGSMAGALTSISTAANITTGALGKTRLAMVAIATSPIGMALLGLSAAFVAGNIQIARQHRELDAVARAARGAAPELTAYGVATTGATTATRLSIDEFKEEALSVDDVGVALQGIFGPLAKATGATGGLRTGTGELSDATKAYREDLADLVADMSGAGLIRQSLLTADALAKIGGTTKLTAEETATYNAFLDETIKKMRLMGLAGTAEFDKIRAAWLATSSAMMASTISSNPFSILQGMSGGLGKLGAAPPVSLPVSLGPIDVSQIGKQLGALQPPPEAPGFGQRLAGAMSKGFSAGLAGLGSVIVGAIQGGGSIPRAAFASLGGSIGGEIGTTVTSSLTKSLGKGLAGAIGGAMGPLGALLGNAIGGLFGKVFGSAGRDSVKDFAASMGGFDALRAKLVPLGDEGERLWRTLTQGVGKNNPQQAAAAIKAIEDALARAEREAVDTQNEILKLTAEIADLQAKSKPTFEDMIAAAEKFGIEINTLGPAFQQQRLTAQATEIWNAFETLRLGGADVNAVLVGMSDEISKLVQDSLQFGTTIPSNMKPMLQSLIDAGLLTDAEGNKLKDLTGINFGEPVESEWEIIAKAIDKLSKALDDLIKKLDQGVTGAANRARRAFEDWEIPDVPTPGGSGGGGRSGGGSGGGPGVPELDEGGVANWGPQGTLAMLHNTEAVIPIDRLEQMMGGGGECCMSADEFVSAFQAAGFGRPNVSLSSTITGALASDMNALAEMLLPLIRRALQDNGTERGAMSATLGVGSRDRDGRDRDGRDRDGRAI